MVKKQKIDWLVLLWPPIAALLVFCLDFSYLAAIFIFYIPPALYVLITHAKRVFLTKTLLFSFLASIPFFVIVDYIGTASKLWWVPQTSFPFRLFGLLPIEDYLWMALGAVLIITLYQAFFDRSAQHRLGTKMKYFFTAALLSLAVFFIVLFINSKLLSWHTRFAYAFLGSIFFLAPSLLLLIYRPTLFKKQLPVTLYFLYLTVFFEAVATQQHLWVYTGRYIFPPVSFFGFGRVALEELFFVGIIGPFAAMTFYEFFDDDNS